MDHFRETFTRNVRQRLGSDVRFPELRLWAGLAQSLIDTQHELLAQNLPGGSLRPRFPIVNIEYSAYTIMPTMSRSKGALPGPWPMFTTKNAMLVKL